MPATGDETDKNVLHSCRLISKLALSTNFHRSRLILSITSGINNEKTVQIVTKC